LKINGESTEGKNLLNGTIPHKTAFSLEQHYSILLHFVYN